MLYAVLFAARKRANCVGAARRKEGRRRRGDERTDAEENEEDEEDLADGNEGEGEGGEDLAEGLEAAEEAEHAQGAHDAHDARGLVGEDEGEEGHAHDEHVEPAPRIGNEWKEPVSEGEDHELGCEDDGEREIQTVEDSAEVGGGAVGVGELACVLRLQDGADETLCAEKSGPLLKTWIARNERGKN